MAMQNKFNGFRLFGGLLVLLSFTFLSGCAGHMRQHKPDDGGGNHQIEKDYSISFDTKGNLVVKDSKGRRVERSGAKSTFPIKSSRILSIKTYTIVHFEGSDCVAITFSGQTDSFCFTH